MGRTMTVTRDGHPARGSYTVPDASSASQRFYRHYGKAYERTNTSTGRPDWAAAELQPRIFKCRRPWLPENKAARILDFGCGWGHQLLSLWCAGYRNLEGVDMSPEQATLARRLAGGRVPITCMDGREYLSGKDACYDVILAYDVIEHFPVAESLDLLEQLRRALVPGGTIVIRVPNANELCSARSLYIDATHVMLFTEFSLMQLLDEAGFEDHRLVEDNYRTNWHLWRVDRPWRGLAIRRKLNRVLHQVVYWLRGDKPLPRSFEVTLEMYSRAPRERTVLPE